MCLRFYTKINGKKCDNIGDVVRLLMTERESIKDYLKAK